MMFVSGRGGGHDVAQGRRFIALLSLSAGVSKTMLLDDDSQWS